jgi:curved DNA-binding protein CbpA
MNSYQRTLARFGLAADAALADIESQWRIHAKRWHPDRNQNSTESHQRFIELRTQFDYLKKHFNSYQQYRESSAKEAERIAQKKAEEAARAAAAQRAQTEADAAAAARSYAASRNQTHGSDKEVKNIWEYKPSEKERRSDGQPKTSASDSGSKVRQRMSPALIGVLAACISLILLHTFESPRSPERSAQHTRSVESLFSDVEKSFPKRAADKKPPRRVRSAPTLQRKVEGDGRAMAAMDAYWSAFYSCLKDPEIDIPQSGSLELSVKIENHEITELVFQKDRLRNKAVKACFIATARALRFPSIEGTHRIVYPFKIILEQLDLNPSA